MISYLAKNSSHVISLEYLKAVCIVFVIILHSVSSGSIKKDWLFPYWIDLAIPVFMVISGYVFSLSIKRNKIKGIFAYFAPSFFLHKFLRFLLPYIILLISEICILKYGMGHLRINNVGYFSLTGGVWGPGSYYVPVLIQFLIAFPFLYAFMKGRWGWGKFIFLIILQFGLEYLTTYENMPGALYRLMFFRYICFVAAGILLARYRISWKVMFLSFIGGTFYIWAANYTSWHITLFHGWKTTSLPTVFYTLPIVWATLKLNKCINFKCRFLSLIGQASYHIFLVQTCYFIFFQLKIPDSAFKLIWNVIICIGIGLIFFLSEKCIKFIVNVCLNQTYHLKAEKKDTYAKI